MKKIILFVILLFGVAQLFAQNKTVTINKDQTYINIPVTAADSIVTSQTYWILINNMQDYPSMQDVYIDLTDVSGSPSVAVSLEARKFAGDSFAEIISAQTWTTSAVKLTIATSNRYRQYKLKFVASGATQKTLLKTVQFKTWFTGGELGVASISDGTATFTAGALTGATTIDATGRITGAGGLTITGGTANLNASSNFATNIGTGSSNGAITIGGNSNTVAVNSSDWDISTAGAMTGIGAITADGLITGSAGANLTGAAINLNASSNFAVNVGTGTTDAAVSIGGGSNTVAINSTALDISTTGAVTGATDITASGVIKGGLQLLAPVLNTDGSETLTAAQSGKMIVASAAGGATTVTLPDPSASTVGVFYYIMQTADQNLIVDLTTADGNSIVCDGVATSDKVTIDTVGHKIGAGMFVLGISATQWYIGGLNPESVLTPETAD